MAAGWLFWDECVGAPLCGFAETHKDGAARPDEDAILCNGFLHAGPGDFVQAGPNVSSEVILNFLGFGGHLKFSGGRGFLTSVVITLHEHFILFLVLRHFCDADFANWHSFSVEDQGVLQFAIVICVHRAE